MNNIMPKNQSIKSAVQWISEKLKENPETPIAALINQVTFRFDLTPSESQFLVNFYKDDNNDASESDN